VRLSGNLAASIGVCLVSGPLLQGNPLNLSKASLPHRLPVVLFSIGPPKHPGQVDWKRSCNSEAMSSVKTMSEIAIRPPSRTIRKASSYTASLSGHKLMTQLEITTSAKPSGSYVFSKYAVRNSMFLFCKPVPPTACLTRSII
jgi:hypothetical protein